jgi:hypothetical protein
MTVREFHPLADLFPLMQGEAFDALVADIKANGLHEKIDLYQGKIVDGRNRYRALRQLGIEPDDRYFRKAIYAHTIGGEIGSHERNNDDAVLAYVVSRNIHRRHLTAEQKRDLIAKLVKAQPEKSNRAIAKQARVDDKTVGAVRRQLESTAEIPQLEKTVGADGRARKQPTKPQGNDVDPEASAEARKAEYTDQEATPVADPTVIKKNFLDTVDQSKAMIRACGRVFKVAPLNQELKGEIVAAIDDVIKAWTRLRGQVQRI